MAMEQSLVPAVAARPECRLACTSPRAIGISLRHVARMAKQPPERLRQTTQANAQ